MAKIKGKGGPRADKINIKVSNGEYVLPADTTNKVGTDKLDQLVQETHEFPHTKKGEEKEREYAGGGIVNSALRWMGANIAPSIIGQSGMQSQAAVDAAKASAPTVQAPGSGLDEGARQRVLAARQALRTMNDGSYKPDYSKYADGSPGGVGWFGRLVGGATKAATDAGNNRQAQLDAAEAAATGPQTAPPPASKPKPGSDDPIAMKVRERLRKAGIEGYADGSPGSIKRPEEMGPVIPQDLRGEREAQLRAELHAQNKVSPGVVGTGVYNAAKALYDSAGATKNFLARPVTTTQNFLSGGAGDSILQGANDLGNALSQRPIEAAGEAIGKGVGALYRSAEQTKNFLVHPVTTTKNLTNGTPAATPPSGVPEVTKNALDAKYGALPPAAPPAGLQLRAAPPVLTTPDSITTDQYKNAYIKRDGNSFSGTGTTATPIKGLSDAEAKQQTADYVGSQLRAADIYKSMREPTGGAGGGMDSNDFGMAQNEINKRYDKMASDADSTFRSSKAQGNKLNALADIEKQRGAELGKLGETDASLARAGMAGETKSAGQDLASQLALSKFGYDVQRDKANAERQSAEHAATLRQTAIRDQNTLARGDAQARTAEANAERQAGREQRLAIDDAAKQATAGDPEALARLRAFEASNPDYKASNSPEDANAYANGLKMQSDILDQANKDRSIFTGADTFLPDDVSPVEKRDFEPMSDPGKGTALRSYLTGSFGNNKVYEGKRGKVIRSSGLTPEQRAYMDEEYRKNKLRSK